MKNNNYIVIQGWMIKELNLKGNELIVFATIYGFTQDENSWFEGSRKYLAEWSNSTIRGIQKNLDSLVEKKLLIKSCTVENNVKHCKYKVNIDFIEGGKDSENESSPNMDTKLQYKDSNSCSEDKNNLSHVSRLTAPREQSSLPLGNKVQHPKGQSSPPQGTKFTAPREQSSLPLGNKVPLDNIKYNIHNNIYINIIESQVKNQDLKKVLYDFLRERKLKKEPLTDLGVKTLLNKLERLAPNDPKKQIEMLENSILHNWRSVYPIEEKRLVKKSHSSYAASYDLEAYEKESIFDLETYEKENLSA